MVKRTGYFKHYNTASIGESLSTLARRKEYLAICLFWHSLEILNQKNSEKAEVFMDSIMALYNARRKTIEASYRAISEVIGTYQVSFTDYKVIFSIANYLESQDFGVQKKRYKDKDKDKDKDKKREKEKQTELSLVPEPRPKNFLAEAWNEHCTNLAKVRVPVSHARQKKITNRLKEFPNEEDWVNALKKINASSFCCGKNDRGWMASFDWLLQNETLEKILEGKYDDKRTTKSRFRNDFLWKNPNEHEDVPLATDRKL